MGAGHYENFPVASMLMPAALRPAVLAIYRFARTADDIADEGEDAPAQRLNRLAELDAELDRIEAGDGSSGSWPDLAAAVAHHRLPVPLLRDLLSAFAQDVRVSRYADFAAVRDYCRRSADPIGRLMLALHRRADERTCAWSDAICTGLQLTNFWQDIALDWRKGRVYLPQEDMQRFAVDEGQIAAARVDDCWRALLRFEVERARGLLDAGRPLARALGGRAGFELRLVIEGGTRILERIERVGGDVFRARPTLAAPDWLLMAWRALRWKAA